MMDQIHSIVWKIIPGHIEMKRMSMIQRKAIIRVSFSGFYFSVLMQFFVLLIRAIYQKPFSLAPTMMTIIPVTIVIIIWNVLYLFTLRAYPHYLFLTISILLSTIPLWYTSTLILHVNPSTEALVIFSLGILACISAWMFKYSDAKKRLKLSRTYNIKLKLYNIHDGLWKINQSPVYDPPEIEKKFNQWWTNIIKIILPFMPALGFFLSRRAGPQWGYLVLFLSMINTCLWIYLSANPTAIFLEILDLEKEFHKKICVHSSDDIV
jgi:hypothetical protein